LRKTDLSFFLSFILIYMDPQIKALRKLQSLVNNFSLISRRHMIPGTERYESDTEHTLAVTMLAWQIQTMHKLPLDTAKILKYAIAHDLVEVYAGDVNTFASKTERAEKVIQEKKAMASLAHDLPEFKDLHKTIAAYEERADDESLFVWTVDKMQALLLGDLDSWRPYKNLSISYETFCARHDELLDTASPHAKQIYSALYEHCKETYYDKP